MIGPSNQTHNKHVNVPKFKMFKSKFAYGNLRCSFVNRQLRRSALDWGSIWEVEKTRRAPSANLFQGFLIFFWTLGSSVSFWTSSFVSALDAFGDQKVVVPCSCGWLAQKHVTRIEFRLWVSCSLEWAHEENPEIYKNLHIIIRRGKLLFLQAVSCS